MWLMFCTYDYGLNVLKSMESWDGVPNFDGKNILEYTSVGSSFIIFICFVVVVISWVHKFMHDIVFSRCSSKFPRRFCILHKDNIHE